VVTLFDLEGPESAADIAAGPDGNLWFTEDTGGRITRMSPAGVVTGRFEVDSASMSSLRSITTGPDANLWFVQGFPSGSAERIGRIAPTGGVTTFSAGTGPGSSIGSLAAGPDGNLWFTTVSQERRGRDFVSIGRIGRMTPAGSVILFPARLPTLSGSLDIASGPDGNLWFTGNSLGRITPTGTLTMVPPAPRIGAVHLQGARAVTVGLRCPVVAPHACRGTLVLALEDTGRRVSARRYRIEPGHLEQTSVRLGPGARRRLRSSGFLRLRIDACWRPFSLLGADGRSVVLRAATRPP
jgi:streptogramin lyase